MARQRMAAQEQRRRRRLRSITKQHSNGIQEPNTAKYARWGRRGSEGDER